MGRKDAVGQHSAPVDQYRKQIGRYDEKKPNKACLGKSRKNATEESIPLTAKNIAIMLGVMVALFSLLYMTLFWYLGFAPLEDVREKTPV